jgi:hypothetical protein
VDHATATQFAARGRNGVGVRGDLLRPNGELVITSRVQLAQQAARQA